MGFTKLFFHARAGRRGLAAPKPSRRSESNPPRRLNGTSQTQNKPTTHKYGDGYGSPITETQTEAGTSRMGGSGTVQRSDPPPTTTSESASTAKPSETSPDSMHWKNRKYNSSQEFGSSNGKPDRHSENRYSRDVNPIDPSTSPAAATGISDAIRRFEVEEATATITATLMPQQTTPTPLAIYQNIIADGHSRQFNGQSTHIYKNNLQINFNPDSLLLPVVVALAHEKAPAIATVTVTGTFASTTIESSTTAASTSADQIPSSKSSIQVATTATMPVVPEPTREPPHKGSHHWWHTTTARKSDAPTSQRQTADISSPNHARTPLCDSLADSDNIDIHGSSGSKTTSSAHPIPHARIEKAANPESLQLLKQSAQPTHLPINIHNCLLLHQPDPSPPKGIRKIWALLQRKSSSSSLKLNLDTAVVLKIRTALHEITGRAAGALDCVDLVRHLKELDPSLLMMVMPLIMAGNQISGSSELGLSAGGVE